MFQPSYLRLYESGELRKRISFLFRELPFCELCPNKCRVNRFSQKNGDCRSGFKPVISLYCIHYGEEPILVGSRENDTYNGVGNIFLGNCNLKCVYCQNYQISQYNPFESKQEKSIYELAEIMLDLQNKNVNSVGFVSPSHFITPILLGLEYAISKGFNLPIIYNTNAYDSLNVLKLLDGIFDIYLPDIKYSNDDNALRYSKIRNYVYHSRKAIAEMYRQVGSKLKMENGVLKRGMIIRHLILPDDLSGSYNSLRYISELDKNISISLMAQYYPSHIANNYGQLSRTVNKIEYERVMDWMDKLELENGFIQELESSSTYQPDFTDKENPFKF